MNDERGGKRDDARSPAIREKIGGGAHHDFFFRALRLFVCLAAVFLVQSACPLSIVIVTSHGHFMVVAISGCWVCGCGCGCEMWMSFSLFVCLTCPRPRDWSALVFFFSLFCPFSGSLGSDGGGNIGNGIASKSQPVFILLSLSSPFFENLVVCLSHPSWITSCHEGHLLFCFVSLSLSLCYASGRSERWTLNGNDV